MGRNRGTVTSSYATGSVSGGSRVGGLVGENYLTSLTVRGSVTASYADVAVNGDVGPVGGLVGDNEGTVRTSYATGDVTGLAANLVGGLVGRSDELIIASYATGSVSVGRYSEDVGGLLGQNNVGAVVASYATGSVSVTVSGHGDDVGGLVGEDEHDGVFNSYFEGSASGRTFGIGSDDGDNDNAVDSDESNSLPGKTTAQLRSPTAYGTGSDIYAGWNVDIDNADNDDTVATGGDDPWDFGTSRQYPALKADFNADGTTTWQEFDRQAASSADYDTDDDGLIEVDSLAKLNAMRWDLDGDGLSRRRGLLGGVSVGASGAGPEPKLSVGLRRLRVDR